MEVIREKREKVDIVHLVGRFEFVSSLFLEQELDKIVKTEKRRRIILDMEKVEFFGARAIRILIRIWKEIGRYNRGCLVLAKVPERVKHVLDLAGVLGQFRIFDNVEDAVKCISEVKGR